MLKDSAYICKVSFRYFMQFLACDSIYAIARYMLSPVRLSVCLSVTWVDQSKTVEVRIMQLSPQSSPMTSFLKVNFTAKFQREHREWAGGAE